jgi:hypothetical protein
VPWEALLLLLLLLLVRPFVRALSREARLLLLLVGGQVAVGGLPLVAGAAVTTPAAAAADQTVGEVGGLQGTLGVGHLQGGLPLGGPAEGGVLDHPLLLLLLLLFRWSLRAVGAAAGSGRMAAGLLAVGRC